MEYHALAVGMADDLLLYLQTKLAPRSLRFESAPTLQAANRRLGQGSFFLLIVDLEYLRSIGQLPWLWSVRRVSFAPLIALSDTPEDDIGNMVELGADICVSGTRSRSIVADVAYALFRRYTKYNHYRGVQGAAAPFQEGDIFIDPARRIVKVRGRPVSLRPREFSLLLCFMQHPNIVLSSEQICESAWGTDGIYGRGIAHPIRLLRTAIEPDPQRPVYIETVRLVGYRFTAKCVETCDISCRGDS